MEQVLQPVAYRDHQLIAEVCQIIRIGGYHKPSQNAKVKAFAEHLRAFGVHEPTRVGGMDRDFVAVMKCCLRAGKFRWRSNEDVASGVKAVIESLRRITNASPKLRGRVLCFCEALEIELRSEVFMTS